MNGKGSSARPSLTVSNLFGLGHRDGGGFAEPGGCHGWSARGCMRVFMDAVNFVAGQSGGRPGAGAD
ncbi:hypothetical protein [Escherichia coli]|uniref:hypothetical protein n=1 Tax=Escherichia coli TaxID=562 RepID=UPI00397FB818